MLAPGARALAQSDPASSAPSQALRVLLGSGQLEPIDRQTFLYEGRRYRGTAVMLADGNVVSTVPLEQYLYSVVSREMPRSWPGPALQAQAIAARTYVLQRSDPNREYDLVPSEADQVYTGIDAEAAQTTAAVDATAGRALRFAGEFALIAYSSCCGGHTESSADAWGGAPLSYLSGVPCTYCNDSSWYNWTQNVPLERFAAVLRPKAQSLGDLQQITVAAPDASGRARYWDFIGTTGSIRMKAADVRRSVGPRVLPSLLVRSIQRDFGAAEPTEILEGGGLGHGVGLCQWGARGLALTGAGGDDILKFYFPGTTITAI